MIEASLIRYPLHGGIFLTRMTAAEYVGMINGANKKHGRYGKNKKIKTDEGYFDCKAEYGRWNRLKQFQDLGMITDLERQIPYRFEVNGVLICTYNADFRYKMPDGTVVVEDYKGKIITPEFRLKQKMMLAFYGIKLRIVRVVGCEPAPS